MKNTELKKEILRVTKRLENFQVRVTLWHGDTEEFKNAIYNEIMIFVDDVYFDLRDFESYGIYVGKELDYEDTEDNMELLQAEQKKVYTYLKKHFSNVIIEECNV